MRRSPVLSVALAALFIASVASAVFAAKPQSANADIQQLGASGISGSADFKFDQDGNARVHEQLSGLEPGGVYQTVVYLSAATCGTGTDVLVMEFTANNAGRANFNTPVPVAATPLIAGGAFISVQQSTTLLACGQIVPEQ